MTEEKKIWLQIPTEVVRNIGFKVDEKSFAVYAFLLYQLFKGGKKNYALQIDHNTMKNVIGINDNRTLKRCFKVLHEQGLITNLITTLPSNTYLDVELVEELTKGKFTQLPLNLLNKAKKIGLHGFRLMYYYESYINRRDVTKDFCYPSYIVIRKDLNISDDTLTKYNNLLKKDKLLSITKHEVQFDNPLDEDRFTRFNNHYRVNLLNI